MKGDLNRNKENVFKPSNPFPFKNEWGQNGYLCNVLIESLIDEFFFRWVKANEVDHNSEPPIVVSRQIRKRHNKARSLQVYVVVIALLIAAMSFGWMWRNEN